MVSTLWIRHATSRSVLARLPLHATDTLSDGLVALQAVGLALLSLLLLGALDRSACGGGSLEEGRGTETHALLAVEDRAAGSGIEHGRLVLVLLVGISGSSGGKVSRRVAVIVTHESGVVGTLVEGSGSAQGHVQRVLGESLHRGAAAALSVAVGVCGVEWAIVVEH